MKPSCPFCEIKGVESDMKMIADADSVIGEMWRCMNKH